MNMLLTCSRLASFFLPPLTFSVLHTKICMLANLWLVILFSEENVASWDLYRQFHTELSSALSILIQSVCLYIHAFCALNRHSMSWSQIVSPTPFPNTHPSLPHVTCSQVASGDDVSRVSLPAPSPVRTGRQTDRLLSLYLLFIFFRN